MNFNHMAACTTVRKRWNDTDNHSRKILISVKKKETIEQLIKVLKWLLQPESENELPLFESRFANIWANTGKILFWFVIAIGIGFLIAPLSS